MGHHTSADRGGRSTTLIVRHRTSAHSGSQWRGSPTCWRNSPPTKLKALSKVTLDITPDKKLPGCIVRATVKVTGPTGVEMEALTAVSVACLTIYDMIKAVERGVRIEGIHLVEKKGGKSGHYRAGDGA